MKKLLFLILWLTYVPTVDANTTDSLQEQLTTALLTQQWQEVINLQIQIGETFIQQHNFTTAEELYEQALNIAQRENLATETATILFLKGKLERRTERYEQAIVSLEEAQQNLSSKPSMLLAEISHEKSKSYQLLGNNELAYEFALKSLQFYKILSDEEGIMRSHYQIGNILFYQGNYDLALKTYYETQELAQQLDHKKYLYNTMEAIGGTYSRLGATAESIKYNTEAYKLAEEMDYTAGIAYSAHNLGTNYLDQLDYQNALSYLEKSYQLKKQIKDRWGEVAALDIIGNILLEQKDFTKALEYLKRALYLARAIESKPRTLEAYQSLARAYEKIGNIEKSCAYLKSYIALKDSLINESTIQMMQEAQTRYEVLQKEQALFVKNQEIIKIYKYVALGIVLAMGLLLWLFYSKMAQQYTLSDQLKEKNLQIKKQNKQLADIKVAINGRDLILGNNSSKN